MRNIKVDSNGVKDADSGAPIYCPASFSNPASFDHGASSCDVNCAWYSEDSYSELGEKDGIVLHVVAKCKDHVIGLLRIVDKPEEVGF